MTDDVHRAIREALGAYVLGQLDEAEAARVRAHLDGCSTCRAEHDAIAPLAVALREVDPENLERVDEPGAVLGRRIEDAIAAERARQSRRALLTRVGLGVAASVLLLVAFVAGAFFTTDETPSPVPLEAVEVTSEVAGVTASADLVDHTWGVEVKLIATGLEDGAVYKTTVLGTDGVQYPAGEFLGVADVEVKCNMNSSVLRADAAAFTVWDSNGEPVMTADL